MLARIHKMTRNVMQSGKAKTRQWILDYTPERPRVIEPLMGYTSSTDMRQQIRLFFADLDEAIAYCTREGIPFRVETPHEKVLKPMSYADNFRFDRPEMWTH